MKGQRTVQKHIQLGFRSLQNMVLWITAGKDLSKDSKKPDLKEGKNLEIKEENAAADQGTAKQISDGFVSDECRSDLWNCNSECTVCL